MGKEGNTLKKGLLKALLVVVVILCLAAPVIAEGGFFSKIFSWLDFFFTGSPSGAQTFDLGVIAGVSPDSLAQGAVAPVQFYGSFVNETVSVASPLVLLNQTIVNNSVIEAWVSVPVFAAVGSYNVLVGSNSLSLNVTDGPLDFSSVVYSPNSSVSNSTVKFRAEISVAPFVNKAQVSITGGSLVLKSYNVTVVLNLASVDDSGNGFMLSFDEYTFENADYFSPKLKLSLNFVESFSPAVQLDEEFALPAFLVQTYPALCGAIVPPMVPPFVPPFGCPSVFPFGPGLVPTGNDLVTRLPDPGGGTIPATAYCRFGTLCTVANPPWNPVVEVCDMDYVGPIGAPCPLNPVVPPWASACMPPYNIGRCMPAQFICAAGGAYPMYTAFVVPPPAFPLGTLTCSVPAINLCGNGILEGPPTAIIPGPEYCDDGEFPPVDCTNGCDADCTPTECGDFTICAPEECDPPGNTFQCAGGAACSFTCHCPVAPVVPKSGGGKSGSFSAKKCYPVPDVCEQLDALAENEISPFEVRTWAVASFAPGGADLSNPETDTQFPSFQACWDQNIGPQMFGSDQQYLDTFTKVGADGLRRWVKLPASYPSGDAAKYYEKQNEFKNKLSDRAGSFGVVDESADLCAPAGPHIIAVSQAKCEVSDGTVKVYWSRGWMHNWRQEIDRMDFLSTGYVMTAEGFDAKILVSSGSRPDLSIADIGDGVVDGRTDKCKADANNCLETVKKEFKFVPGWSLSLKAVAQDSQKKKDMKSVVLTNDDCTSCPLYVELLDETGKMRNYENPCCDPESNVPAVCCDSDLNFLQGLLLAKETGQCYLMSDAFDGPLKSVCLGGQNVCDIMSPGYLRDNSRAIYNQFYWKPMGIDCEVPFNPFRQSFSGSAFENAVGACPLPPPECEDGQIKRVGSDVGVCKPAIMECVDAHWVVISKGVGPGMELCNGKDDDCNDWIDDTLLCECRKGATQPCFDDAPMPVQTCEKRRAHYYWDTSQCIREKKEPDVLVAPVGDSFAVQTVSGLGVPCGDDKFACCIIFDKQTEGDVVFEEAVSVIPEGYVPVGSYNVQNCDAGDVDIAMNIKPVDSAVAVFKTDVEKRLPVGLKTTLDCAGFDYQKLADKSAIPDVSLIEISEGIVLSEEYKELSAMGVKAEFSGDIDGVKVSLKNADVKIRNKALSTLGAPLEMMFDQRPGINVRISAPLVLKTNMDVNSLGFYVLQNAEWKYLGGSVEGGSFAVELNDISQYSPFVFMIAGSKCLGCEQAYLSLARDVGSSVLVVLVHGFMSAPDRAWSAFLKQFEDEQVAVDVAVFGYQGMKPADAAAVLGSRMHELSVDYDKIVFIAHSLGGLITQEFINNELSREDSIVPKIEAVITAGTPYSGTVVAKTGESLFDVFGLLLNDQDHAPMFGIHRETLEFMQSGLPYSFPPEIKAFSLVGTRDLLGIGSSLGLSEPNDVLVEADSAKSNGVYSSRCVDMLEHYENHFQLNKAPEERYTLLYFLRELSSEFSQRAPPKMYAMLRIDDCRPGEIIVYGRPVNPKEFPPPKGCEQLLCGDGVCQFSENVKTCESDCKSPEKEYAADVCSMSGLVLNVLLGLSVLLIVVYALHPASFLLYSVYGLSGMSLGGLIGNFALCGSLPVIPMVVFGLVLLMLLINYYVRFLPGFYRWH